MKAHPRLIECPTDDNYHTIPRYDPIKVGTLLAVNYAAYHLPAWCYFREKWADLLPPDPDTDRRAEPPDQEDVLIKGLGDEDTFLTRAHEFLRCDNTEDNTYHYLVRRRECSHHIDTWSKFASDNNEELLPPTMNELHFKEVKEKFSELITDLKESTPAPEIQDLPIEPLNEYNFSQFLDKHAHLFPSDSINELLDQIRKYRWRQETVLIEEMHRRIDNILQREGCEFRSVTERRVEYDKEADRIAHCVYAYKIRVEVMVREIENIKLYLGVEGMPGVHSLKDILKSMDEKIKKDIYKDKGTPEDNDIISEIDRLRRFCIPIHRPLEEDIPDVYQLDAPLEYFKRIRDEDINGIMQRFPSNTWEELKRVIMESGNKGENMLELLGRLRKINVEKIQEFERTICFVREKVDYVRRSVKQITQQILERVDKLDKEAKQQENKQESKQTTAATTPVAILSFKRGDKLKSPFSVDDLNVYMRYPPIQNELLLHEGYWPPLRAEESEGTVKVIRLEPSHKEYNHVKLSNVIGRFDEAFTLFSSTLADHAMSRPVPLACPIKFRYGLGEVVPAWDHAIKGLSGMQLGEIRIIVCPSLTAYGEIGVPDSVPPHMPLVYVVRLDGIYKKQDDTYDSEDDIPPDQDGSEGDDQTTD